MAVPFQMSMRKLILKLVRLVASYLQDQPQSVRHILLGCGKSCMFSDV